MMVEITKIDITKDKIKITATNLEDFLMVEDLLEDHELKQVDFDFDRKAYNGAQMKYLYKICKANKKNKDAKSFGEMLDNLIGDIIYLADGFKSKE